MSPARLTPHDANVLKKIKDPESAGALIQIDPSLPKDPNLDPDACFAALAAEKSIMNDVLALQKAEKTANSKSLLAKWLAIILRLDELVENFPEYASARNNRVQALRMVYGDGILVKVWAEESGKAVHPVSDGLPALNSYSIEQDQILESVSRKALADLARGIDLLSPKTIFGAVSPQQATNLANLHMQRGQLFRVAAQKLTKNGTTVEQATLKAEFRLQQQKQSSWSRLDFEENASRDFMMAGRYGNEIGKALAVATNPTAKLCGEMVKEAMKKEFAQGVPTKTTYG